MAGIYAAPKTHIPRGLLQWQPAFTAATSTIRNGADPNLRRCYLLRGV